MDYTLIVALVIFLWYSYFSNKVKEKYDNERYLQLLEHLSTKEEVVDYWDDAIMEVEDEVVDALDADPDKFLKALRNEKYEN
jgi:hypothetical protein